MILAFVAAVVIAGYQLLGTEVLHLFEAVVDGL